METELTASVTTGYVIVALIQWAKRQRWIPFIDHCNTANLNRAVAAVMAVATGVGIHLTYDSAAGSLMVTGLSSSTILPLVGEVVRQFIVQQLIYKGAGFEAKSEQVAADTGSIGVIDARRFRGGGSDSSAA